LFGSSNLIAQNGSGSNGQQVTVNTVTTSVPFVRIAPDARAGAMGDVAIATSPDINSIYQNASKLAFVEGDYGVAIHYTPWLRALVNDINMVSLNGYYKIKKKQSIALGLKYFSLGNITFTDGQANILKDDKPYEMALDAHYARALSKNFGVGIGLRFIYSYLGNVTPSNGEQLRSGLAGSGDLSFYYKQPIKVSNLKTELSLGLAFTNIGSKITYTNNSQKDFIPANFGVGVGYKIEINEHNSIGLYYDLNKLMVPTPDGSKNDSTRRATSTVKGMFTSFNDAPGWTDANGDYVKGSRTKEELRELMHGVAIEYWYSKLLAIRAGYFYEHKTKGARQFLTVGVGVKYSIFGLDFSYLVPTSAQKNPLDNTLRFSLIFDFNKSGNDPLLKRKAVDVSPTP
jgi:hypothetical protein